MPPTGFDKGNLNAEITTGSVSIVKSFDKPLSGEDVLPGFVLKLSSF